MCRLIAIAALSLLGISASANDEVATCDANAQARYLESVRDAVLSNWSVPYADQNIACTVLIQQNWRGEVLHVGIASWGDEPRVHK